MTSPGVRLPHPVQPAGPRQLGRAVRSLQAYNRALRHVCAKVNVGGPARRRTSHQCQFAHMSWARVRHLDVQIRDNMEMNVLSRGRLS